MNIRDRIKMESKGYSLYDVREEKYKANNYDEIPFRVAPSPFILTAQQLEELKNIGYALNSYIEGVIKLYNENEEAKKILDRGKPSIFTNKQIHKYLFLRPDLILTKDGFSICEIETSPFGLALAEILNSAYGKENFNTIVNQNTLKNHIVSNLPKNGTIAYSKKVQAYTGQINFMANEIFSSNKSKWKTQIINGEEIQSEEIYRAFYLSEYMTDENVKKLINQNKNYIPTLTPQIEEKAILSFIWDKRFSEFFKRLLGETSFNFLRKIIPPTWILKEEANFDLGMPEGILNSINLSNLSKKQRQFVLKKSGFSDDCSWSKGVYFLHQMSSRKIKEILKNATEDNMNSYILQEFKEGKKQIMEYIDEKGEILKMEVKTRITPYYSFIGKNKGELIAAKITGCEKTDFIHASTISINTAISNERIDER